MPDIFINYRTGDEEASARVIDQELSRRFGSDQIFRASKSIEPGANFISELLTGVRRSEVLLAVIGSRWLTAVDERGRNRLYDKTDWIRREILEAFEHGVRVIPILVGPTLSRLSSSELPPDLARLADCQYRRLDHRSSGADLRALGDDLVSLVPSLVDRDQSRVDTESEIDGQTSTVLHASEQAHQQVDNVNTVINDAHGPVNSGSGNQFTGDGVNYVTGGQHGGIRQTFGTIRKNPDNEQ